MEVEIIHSECCLFVLQEQIVESQDDDDYEPTRVNPNKHARMFVCVDSI